MARRDVRLIMTGIAIGNYPAEQYGRSPASSRWSQAYRRLLKSHLNGIT